jgi:asparagine synthase (glutamine-hydrolysing)
VLGEIWTAWRGRAPARKVVNSLVTRACAAASEGTEHAWVQAAQRSGLPPGKQLHIRALATNHFNHGVSRRRREADLLFPLLSQPILELCLPIATPDLAGASYDRPFQRAIFADRLPEVVLNRRAKGDLSVYFAKLMANSVGMLRPFLLEGCLCGAGVLDRGVLERVLDPDHMILNDVANDLVGAAAVEAWVRHWQTRVPDAPDAGRIR